MRYLNLMLLALLPTLAAPLSAQEEPAPEPSLWPAMAKPAASDATSLKIIGLHLKARGGAAGLAKVRGIQFTGTLIEGKQDYKVVYSWQPPQGLRIDQIRNHRGDDYITVFATDGASAWRQEVAPKKIYPTDLGGMDKDLLQLDALLPFLFLDPEKSGHLFAYAGETTFGGKKAYVIHAWLKNGTQIEALFDTQSFQILKYRQPFAIAGRKLIVDRIPTGLRREAGVWWETGYSWQFSGKVVRSLEFKKFKTGGVLPPDALKKPYAPERWLRGGNAESP